MWCCNALYYLPTAVQSVMYGVAGGLYGLVYGCEEGRDSISKDDGLVSKLGKISVGSVGGDALGGSVSSIIGGAKGGLVTLAGYCVGRIGGFLYEIFENFVSLFLYE